MNPAASTDKSLQPSKQIECEIAQQARGRLLKQRSIPQRVAGAAGWQAGPRHPLPTPNRNTGETA